MAKMEKLNDDGDERMEPDANGRAKLMSYFAAREKQQKVGLTCLLCFGFLSYVSYNERVVLK